MITCGIDPSRGDLAVSIVKDGKEIDYFKVLNERKGYQKMFNRLETLDTLPAVYIEGHGDFAKRFALQCMQNNIKLYEINPLKSKKLKETITWDKSDHIDAYVAALMPFNNSNLNPLTLDTKVEGLKKLSREYDKMGNTMTAYKNRFHSYLNQNYGFVYKKLFSAVNATSLNFFISFPNPDLVKKASIKEIQNTLIKSGAKCYMGKNGIKKATEIKKIIAESNPNNFDVFTEMTSNLIVSMAKLLLEFIKQRNNLAKEIDKALKKYFPEYIGVFEGKLKSVATITLASLIAEIGNIKSFANDGKLAAFAGQAPRNLQSAKVRKKGKRKSYDRYLAKTVHMIALNNSKEGGLFHDYYEEKKKHFAKKLRALKSVKRLVCTIIFKVLTELNKKTMSNENAA